MTSKVKLPGRETERKSGQHAMAGRSRAGVSPFQPELKAVGLYACQRNYDFNRAESGCLRNSHYSNLFKFPFPSALKNFCFEQIACSPLEGYDPRKRNHKCCLEIMLFQLTVFF